MTTRHLAPDMATSAQIGAEDLPDIARAGFTVVVCNRPDDEQPGQPPAAVIAAAAREAGLDFVHIPVVGSAIARDQIEAMRRTLETASGPVFGFCRSGMRTTLLWALARARDQKPEALVAAARDAGYDLTPLRALLEAESAA